MKKNKKMLVYALGTGLLLSSGNIPALNVLAEKPTSIESVLANMSPQQLENYKQLQSVEKQGLYLDRTVNLKSDSPVKVIVQLDHHPEKVAQLKAKLYVCFLFLPGIYLNLLERGWRQRHGLPLSFFIDALGEVYRRATVEGLHIL